MGSRLFDEIREQRGLAYSVHSLAHAYADLTVLQLSAGLESAKCVEASVRMREIVTELREQGPTPEEVERARSYAGGARAIAFENTGAVARYGAQQAVVYGEDVDPDLAIERLDQVTYDDVAEVATGSATAGRGVRRTAHSRRSWRRPEVGGARPPPTLTPPLHSRRAGGESGRGGPQLDQPAGAAPLSGSRWGPLADRLACLGGARVADERGALPQRERGPEYVLILVSAAYEGMPWLERVYQAGALWDALEMGAGADVHCYTPDEFERKRGALAKVRAAVENGLDILSDT